MVDSYTKSDFQCSTYFLFEYVIVIMWVVAHALLQDLIYRMGSERNRNSICGQPKILGMSLFFWSLCHAQCHNPGHHSHIN